jgi:RIO kinase 2
MPISAENVRSLQKYDVKTLHAVERLMRRYRWVPLDNLKRSTGFSESEQLYRLGRVMGMNMVKSSSVPYKGYQLTFSGYDALALKTLTHKGTVQALGCLLGEGKEAVVYEALGFGPVVLKFHRVGQRSFQSVRLTRGYMPEDRHFPWIFASTQSAKQEYEALRQLHPRVSVPVPLDQNRNVVAMSFIGGLTLSQCTLADPGPVLEQILDNVTRAYGLGIIHGDLSEFNVMVEEEEVWLIDWPQWVDPAHPHADEILRRDVGNILNHFERKYGLLYPLEDALARVIG